MDGRPGSTTSWSSRMGRTAGEGPASCDQLATDGSGEGTAGGPTLAGSDQLVVRGGEGRGGRGQGQGPAAVDGRGQEGTVLTVSDQLAVWTGDRPVRGEPGTSWPA